MQEELAEYIYEVEHKERILNVAGKPASNPETEKEGVQT